MNVTLALSCVMRFYPPQTEGSETEISAAVIPEFHFYNYFIYPLKCLTSYLFTGSTTASHIFTFCPSCYLLVYRSRIKGRHDEQGVDVPQLHNTCWAMYPPDLTWRPSGRDLFAGVRVVASVLGRGLINGPLLL